MKIRYRSLGVVCTVIKLPVLFVQFVFVLYKFSVSPDTLELVQCFTSLRFEFFPMCGILVKRFIHNTLAPLLNFNLTLIIIERPPKKKIKKKHEKYSEWIYSLLEFIYWLNCLGLLSRKWNILKLDSSNDFSYKLKNTLHCILQHSHLLNIRLFTFLQS